MSIIIVPRYDAWCDECGEVVTPAPRATREEANANLGAHNRIVHDPEPSVSEKNPE